jgi:N6-adenosine-specific RNA methylase IME4
MDTETLAALPVKDITLDDAVLFLWTTGPFLVDGSAQKVAKGWGFKPVTLLYWHKVKKNGGGTHGGGVGYWFRGNCEPVLVAKRGAAYRWSNMVNWLPADANALFQTTEPETVFEAPKMEHSQKPDVLHERVERANLMKARRKGEDGEVKETVGPGYPSPYLELFGRKLRDGWVVVGNQSPVTCGEDIAGTIERLARSERREVDAWLRVFEIAFQIIA